MFESKYIYNTNLAKGTGLLNETLTLIDFYDERDTKTTFLERCIAYNTLNRSTDKRTKDLINLVFFDRYWKKEPNVIAQLKALRENHISLSAIRSLLLVYTARANRILFDFVVDISKNAAQERITNEKAMRFVLEAISEGNAPEWSDSIIKRVSSYLISCLKDFELIDKDGYKSFKLPDQKVFNYLLHELHFEGKNELELVHDPIWKLFGLTDYDVMKEIEKISFKGVLIYQSSGQIMKIEWTYKSMKEFIDNEFR